MDQPPKAKSDWLYRLTMLSLLLMSLLVLCFFGGGIARLLWTAFTLGWELRL